MKLIPALLGITILLSCKPVQKIERLDGTRISQEELSKRVQQLVDTAKVSGLALSIFNSHNIIYQKAFGFANQETGDSLAIDHIFYGASLSKAVFGYLVAQLAIEGVLDLDKPLQSYLDTPIPDIPFAKEWRSYKDLKGDDRYKLITARMCMNHTSGLPNWRWISKEGEFQPEGSLEIWFDPGSRYSYSGEGMNLLQYVIEQIVGKGLEEIARERVFGLLQMSQTSYLWQDHFEGNFCLGHTAEGSPIRKDKADEAGAAGSMETTLLDYSQFLSHILDLTKRNSEVTKQLFAPSVRIRSRMQFGPGAWEDTDAYKHINLAYGIGWGLLTSPHGYGAFKEGHGEGFQHYSILFPEKGIGILMLSNSDNAESIFKELLALAIGDIYTPWEWENYVPHDHNLGK